MIEIGFSTPFNKEYHSVFSISIRQISTSDWFLIQDYLNQYQAISLPVEFFRFSSYEGDFGERVQAFLKAATDLSTKYLEPALNGQYWPEVDFDWGDVK